MAVRLPLRCCSALPIGVLLRFVAKWYVPGDESAVRRPSLIWRRKMEDWIAFFIFLHGPLCII
jgi:hypothetical protein